MKTLLTLWTVTELKLMGFAGIAWTSISLLLGGIDEPITALFYLVILDFATGVFAGWRTEVLSSKHGVKGIFKKVSMFVAVAFMVLLDAAMGTAMLRGMAITGFALIEALSVLENIDRMGYGEYIPEFIRGKLVQIRKEKGV